MQFEAILLKEQFFEVVMSKKCNVETNTTLSQ